MEGFITTVAIFALFIAASIEAYKLGELKGEIKAMEEFIDKLNAQRKKRELEMLYGLRQMTEEEDEKPIPDGSVRP